MALPHDPTSPANLPQADTASSAWDPSTISNIVFSGIMVFIGIIAIWQAHRVHRAHHRSIRPLDQEELIGMQLLSRASSALSDQSHDVDHIPRTVPSRQATLPPYDRQTVELPTPVTGVELGDQAGVCNDIAVAA